MSQLLLISFRRKLVSELNKQHVSLKGGESLKAFDLMYHRTIWDVSHEHEQSQNILSSIYVLDEHAVYH